MLALLLIAQAVQPVPVPQDSALRTPLPAPPQEPAPEGPVLALPEALRAAREQSPDLAVARERVEQSRNNVQRAWAALRPTLTAGDPFTAQILFELRKDLSEALPFGRLYGESLGAALVTHLLRNFSDRGRSAPLARGGLPPHRLRRVLEYVNDRLANDLSLAELARVVGLNQAHFARAFKQSTGVSPHRYVLRQRIERASALLRNPRIAIAKVSALSGFASQSSFTTAFRRIKGITPRAYRGRSR